ncbi:MAG: hypothetical protein LBE24_03965 [Methylobacillus sp.]|jgi:hypothetical protein|nr:hypothetical protein [Methylobacillus sp.]
MSEIALLPDSGLYHADVRQKINELIERVNNPFTLLQTIPLTGANTEMRLPLPDRSWNDLRFRFSGAKIDDTAATASLALHIEAQDGALGDVIDGDGNASNSLALSTLTPASLLDGQLDLGGYTTDFGTMDNIANLSAADVQITQTSVGRIGWRCVGGIYAIHLTLSGTVTVGQTTTTVYPTVTQGVLEVYGRR